MSIDWQRLWRQAETKTRWQIAFDRTPRWHRALAWAERLMRRLPR